MSMLSPYHAISSSSCCYDHLQLTSRGRHSPQQPLPPAALSLRLGRCARRHQDELRAVIGQPAGQPRAQAPQPPRHH
eukprot:4088410-Pyramimonas_sp.AAC.1